VRGAAAERAAAVLVYLVEIADTRRRGLIVSLAPATSGIGTLVAVGTTAIVAGVLSQDQLDDWGWRIPVLLGSVLAGAILLLRTSMHETPTFERLRRTGRLSSSPVRDALSKARRAVWIAFVLSAVGSISYYLGVTYVPTFLNSVAGADHSDALIWSTIAAAVLLVVTPLAGWWADVSGRRTTLVLIGIVMAATAVPLFALLADSGTAGALTAAILLAVGAGAWDSVASSAIPEQFDAADRFSGLAVGYNIAVAIFGGLAPLVATLLIQWTGSDLAPGVMLAAVALASLLLVWRLNETARRPLPGG
jgi:MHS family proline/betaine transporter-like MFS transporter